MSHLRILQSYAKCSPESLPASVLFKHSANNITIFDAFPKSKFHFLILPRSEASSLNPESLASLQALLKADKAKAKEIVTALAEDAKVTKEDIQNEMIRHYGFKWDVWVGFHAVPSMLHLHLHVLSADLCSEKLKHRKHYNSFHPKLGFFLHLDDVLSWFDAEPTYYATLVKQYNPKTYDAKLKENLVCFHCNQEMKNIPILKAHLQGEWDKLERRATANNKKRKIQDLGTTKSDEEPGSDSEKKFKRANAGT